ncbi:hypothetical protein J6590_054768 [Homalodisca vitripennis]|nr:hypothetical protein J6590_054768 [Homalodisca vitripennis]
MTPYSRSQVWERVRSQTLHQEEGGLELTSTITMTYKPRENTAIKPHRLNLAYGYDSLIESYAFQSFEAVETSEQPHIAVSERSSAAYRGTKHCTRRTAAILDILRCEIIK